MSVGRRLQERVRGAASKLECRFYCIVFLCLEPGLVQDPMQGFEGKAVFEPGTLSGGE